MSITYTFEVNIAKKENFDLSAIYIIESFLEADWSLYSEKNEVIYTDVGDNDDFDFLSKAIRKKDYFDIVMQKQKNNEIIALALFLSEKNNRYRIDMMITPEFDILLSPDDKTKKILISNLKVLDVNWYLCKILPALANKNLIIESFSFIQY